MRQASKNKNKVMIKLRMRPGLLRDVRDFTKKHGVTLTDVLENGAANMVYTKGKARFPLP